MLSHSMDTVAYYSMVAPDFHASYQGDPNRLERLRVWEDCLDRHAQKAAFAYDIGCGSGILACELARRGIETVGLDGAAGMLAIARQASKESGLTNLSFRQLYLPPVDASGFREADLVIASSAIEYMESIPEALAFMRRLLKDRGIVLLSVSNRDSLSRLMVRVIHCLTGRPRYLSLLKHFVTADALLAECRAAGLTCVEYTYFSSSDRINRFLSRFLSPRYSTNMILVVARKD